VVREGPGGNREADPALPYIQELDESTMSIAWGPDKTPEDRRRIVQAALIFGKQFEERIREHPPENLEEREFQRFLMALMNAVISEFAEREGIDQASAATFLGDLYTRDYVLEFNEVLEEFADKPEKSLNEHLKAAVENREIHARWADHWSSG
jgi:(2Fe-2S) ferredoxin